MDDILIFGASFSVIEEVKGLWSKNFEIKDLAIWCSDLALTIK